MAHHVIIVLASSVANVLVVNSSGLSFLSLSLTHSLSFNLAL